MNITRCSNNFGPRQDPEKLIPNFISKLKKDLQVPLYGDGLNVRDWLYVDDHCRGVYLVLTKGKPGEIYNIGGGSEYTNLALTHKLLELLGKDETYICSVTDRLGHDRRYSVNIDKISELGYIVNDDFEKNLKKTIDWNLSNLI